MKKANHFDSNQQGLALVIVLWVTTLLSLLALGFTRNVGNEVRITHNIKQDIQARYLAEAAINMGIYQLLGLVKNGPLTEPDKLTGEFELDNNRLSYQIEIEQGKIDINFADHDALKNLLLAIGAETEQADSIADAILDWRDKNDLKRLHGAEKDEYSQKNRPGRPENRPFISIRQSQEVLGMTDTFYEKLQAYITVHSYSDKINPLFASAEVLQSLPGVDTTVIEAFISERDEPDSNTRVNLPEIEGIEQWSTDTTGPVYTIRGTVMSAETITYEKKLIIWLPDNEEDLPYYILDAGQ